MSRARIVRIIADAEGCTTAKAERMVDEALAPEHRTAKARATVYRQGLEMVAGAHENHDKAYLQQIAADAIELGDGT